MNRSYTATTISLSLLLLLLGAVAYFVLGARATAEELSSNLTISLFLNEDITSKDKFEIETRLKGDTDVESFVYLSSADATREFEKSTGIVVGGLLENSPIPASFEIKPVRAELASQIQKRAQSWSGVASTLYPEDISANLLQKVAAVNQVILTISALLLVVALSLIYYTLKLSIISNAEAIRTMLLVGAKRSFIKRPYIKRSVVQGFVASMIAGLLLFVLTEVLNASLPVIAPDRDWEQLAMIVASMCVAGVVLSSMFTAFVLNRIVK